ncbi:MFS transporter [Urechidicola croceus]|uniref:MFS transporter n=1 Tax=Urechidicola croceus TaxID=1850246 RepID=A0A1D8P4S2_9FLAO|nr:MFS transporter [Urechidicola croceus]AOW19590.1 MFS transporter [Urechidicola croceus]
MSRITKNQERIALSAFFFLSGICFSTWASRIPTIKELFNLNEAQLGTILLAMPVCSLIGLPVSGWLVSKFESRKPLLASFVLFAFSLIYIGFVKTTFSLVIGISVFAFCLRILNIAMNAQSIVLQQKFKQKIVGSFHGIWSLGGVIGVLFSTLMVRLNVTMQYHLLIIATITLITIFIAYRYSLQNDKAPTGNKLILGKPDPFILYLGLLVFFAAICEGGMYDWSGVYFNEVVNVEIFTYGYLIFMVCMTIARFSIDYLIDAIGMQKMYIISALFIATGILIAIIFPHFWTALLGFCLVGIGTSPIFPITYILAGKSTKYSPGIAISIVGTYAIAGMFIGPPLIGYLAHAFGLKNAFITFIIGGLMFIPISQLFFKMLKKVEKG